MADEADIMEKVHRLLSIEEHGRIIKVHKFDSIQPDAGIYRRRGTAKAFVAAVDVEGRVTYNVTEEMQTEVGKEQKLDGLIVFSRLELKEKFPLAAENKWLSEDDRFEVDGHTYEAVKVKPSGRIHNYCSLVLVYVVLSDTVNKNG